MKILLNGLSDRVLSLRYYVCLQRKDADCEKFCMLASAFDEEDFYKIYVKNNLPQSRRLPLLQGRH